VREASVSKDEYFHTTSPQVVNNIFQNGFATGIKSSLELGPGVYLSVNRTAYPTHLTTHDGKTSSVTTIRVAVDPSVKFLNMEFGANTPLQIIRALYGYDEGNKVYDKLSKQLFAIGGPNWRFIHNLLIQNGYGGIKRENDHEAGNRDVVVFDASKVKPIEVVG